MRQGPELYESWTWYESRARGLGDRFFTAVESAIDQVAMWPNSGSPVEAPAAHSSERLIATSGFPYLVRYRLVPEAIIVTAIYHHRRHPDHGVGR